MLTVSGEQVVGFSIGKSFSFAAAHHLPSVPPGHKSARLHGHTYTVEVTVAAETLDETGFVTDFGDLAALGRFDEHWDHRDLNEVVDFEPTSEALAQFLAGWFRETVEPHVHGRLVAMRVSESPTSWAEFRVEPR